MRPVTRFVVALGAAAALAGCTSPMGRIGEGEYRNGVGVGATSVLADRGVRLAGPLRCTVGSADGWRTVTSTCHGSTTGGVPVRVDGVARRADSAHPVERYRISVDDRVVATLPRLP